MTLLARPAVTGRIDAVGQRVDRTSISSLALVAMATGAVTSLISIGREPLSWDEAVTLDAAERRPAQLVAMLRHTDAPLGLYYALMHVWVRLGDLVGIGHSAVWLRLPSALAAIAAIGLLVTLVAGWFDRRTAVLSGMVLAIHPLWSFYAQDARPYALVTCAFLAATWLLERALARPNLGRLAAYTVVATLTLYLHLFVIYAFTAHVVRVAQRRAGVRRCLGVAAVVAAAVLPLVLIARQQASEISWIGPPTSRQVVSVLEHLLGGAWLGALLVLLATLAVVRARPGPNLVVALAVWVLLPVLALVLVDLWILPDLVARYALVCLPALVTLATVAGSRRREPGRGSIGQPIRRRVRDLGLVGPALLVVAVGLATATTWTQDARPYKYEDYRAADDAMGDLAAPGDGVMFFPQSMRVGFEAYQHLEPDVGNVQDLALAPGGTPPDTPWIGGVDEPPARIGGRFATAPRIFVLGNTLTAEAQRRLSPTDSAQLAVLSGYRIVRTLRWGVVSLTVLDRAS